MLHNLGFLPELKDFTRNVQDVVDYLNELDHIEAFKAYVLGIARLAIRSYLWKGYDTLFLGCGCTGCLHRSAYIGNFLAKRVVAESSKSAGESGQYQYDVRLMFTNI